MSRLQDFMNTEKDVLFIDMEKLKTEAESKKFVLKPGEFDYTLRTTRYAVLSGNIGYECYYYGRFVGNTTIYPTTGLIDTLNSILPRIDDIIYVSPDDNLKELTN